MTFFLSSKAQELSVLFNYVHTVKSIMSVKKKDTFRQIIFNKSVLLQVKLMTISSSKQMNTQLILNVNQF